jgi:uncharacterized protein
MKKYPILLLALIAATLLKAQTADLKLPTIPYPLRWLTPASDFTNNAGGLTITGGPNTDLFVDPLEAYDVINAPKLVFAPDDHFLLSSKVKVNFASDYDAGVLVVFRDEKSWAKFAFELSPGKIPTIVSVVNNGKYSDDCNHAEIKNATAIYLRIAGLDKDTYAFHYSLDGKYWNLVRYFSLDNNGPATPVVAGFSSQSPTGKKCETVFTEMKYEAKNLKDIRNGE